MLPERSGYLQVNLATTHLPPIEWRGIQFECVGHAVGVARNNLAKAAKLNSSNFRRGEHNERIDTEGALGRMAYRWAGLEHANEVGGGASDALHVDLVPLRH
jgi:hypothetical protein